MYIAGQTNKDWSCTNCRSNQQRLVMYIAGQTNKDWSCTNCRSNQQRLVMYKLQVKPTKIGHVQIAGQTNKDWSCTNCRSNQQRLVMHKLQVKPTKLGCKKMKNEKKALRAESFGCKRHRATSVVPAVSEYGLGLTTLTEFKRLQNESVSHSGTRKRHSH